MSSILDYEDRNTCILFGDGAGAAILQRSDNNGILSTHLHCDGKNIKHTQLRKLGNCSNAYQCL